MVKTPDDAATDPDSTSPASEAGQEGLVSSHDRRFDDLETRVAELSQRLAVSSAAAQLPAVQSELVRQQNDRLAELQGLVGALSEQVMAAQALRTRDDQFSAAVRSVESAAAAVQRGLVVPSPVSAPETPQPRESDCGCGDESTSCVSCKCCTFQIWMSHVQVNQMQNPLVPSEVPDTAVGLMEVWMFASIDPVQNVGVCIPDPSPMSSVTLHKQLTDSAGPWISINRLVGTVTLRKGVTKKVDIMLTAVERELSAVEQAFPLNREEFGSGTASVSVDCCYSDYSPIEVHVDLTSWGQGGGAITGKFIVVKP
jgi:hypothetical protein